MNGGAPQAVATGRRSPSVSRYGVIRRPQLVPVSEGRRGRTRAQARPNVAAEHRPARRLAVWTAATLLHLGALLLVLHKFADPTPVAIDDVAVDLVAPLPQPETPPVPMPVQTEAPVPLMRPLRIVHPLAPPSVRPLPPEVPTMPVAAKAPPPQPASPAVSAAAKPPQSYLAELYAHLARYKRYPRSARSAHERGVALLRFTMDRSGTVIGYRIERSSGYADLDAEVDAMIRRAQPLPPLPADMPDRLELVIPVEFTLH